MSLCESLPRPAVNLRNARLSIVHALLSRPIANAAKAALAALCTACGGGGSDGPSITPPTTNNGSFVLLLSAPTLTLAPGASQTLVVTVARTGNFTGAVSLTAAPIPAGVTATFQPVTIAAGATTSTLTIAASTTSPAGTTAVTIGGTGTGVSNTSVGLQFTVAVPPPSNALFTISPSITSFVAPPSGVLTHIPTIAVARNAGYTGAVTFSVTGLPTLVAAAVTPAIVTGSTTSMPIFNAGAPNGTYTATIRAVGANSGGERTATIQVVVASTTTGNITWRLCSSAPRYPAFFVAVKDGSGAWTRVVAGDGGFSYSFNVTQPTASVAWVSLDSGVARTTVYNYTQQEMSALAASECTLYQNSSTRSATGQLTGMSTGELSLVGMGWWVTSTTNPPGSTTSSYSLLNLPAGPLDLVAVRASIDINGFINPNRAIIRRALNPASGGSNGLIDFNAAEAFDMTASTWTVGNTNGEAFSHSQYFNTAGSSTGLFHPVPTTERTVTTRTVHGIPTARSIDGDLHQTILTIGALGLRRATRQVITYSRSIPNRTLSFGPSLPLPTISVVSVADAGLLRAQGTLPTEYITGVALDVKSTGAFARFATINSSRGFLGAGANYDVQLPDLTGVLGWDRNWSIRPGDATNWWVSGGGAILDFFDGRFIFYSTRRRWAGILTGVTAPADGSVYYMGRASGTVTP